MKRFYRYGTGLVMVVVSALANAGDWSKPVQVQELWPGPNVGKPVFIYLEVSPLPVSPCPGAKGGRLMWNGEIYSSLQSAQQHRQPVMLMLDNQCDITNGQQSYRVLNVKLIIKGSAKPRSNSQKLPSKKK